MIFAFHLPASADYYKYVDDNGKIWFVNKLSSVPDRYKDSVKNVGNYDDPLYSSNPKPKAEAQSSSSKRQKKKVEIFVTSWCPYCQKLERFLKIRLVSHYEEQKGVTTAAPSGDLTLGDLIKVKGKKQNG